MTVDAFVEPPLLRLVGVTAGYPSERPSWDRPVIGDVDLDVRTGDLVTLLGANGSGKSCVLLATAGLVRTSAGMLIFDGDDVTRSSAAARARSGISLVPEGRRLFSGMTVRENLELAARSLHRPVGEGFDMVLDLFPQLRGMLDKVSGTLSGGEQQMCAIGRGLMAKPSLLMIDELSLGLSPIVVERLVIALRRVNRELGITVLFVEQAADLAIDVADRVVVLSLGRKVFDGSAADARQSRDVIERAYLGLPA
jgi:branched-chain amino acid transport system ATP-binding protein